MVNWFFWLVMIITFAFFLLIMVLFICQWVIYYRVERTMLHYDQHFYSKEDQD